MLKQKHTQFAVVYYIYSLILNSYLFLISTRCIHCVFLCISHFRYIVKGSENAEVETYTVCSCVLHLLFGSEFIPVSDIHQVYSLCFSYVFHISDTLFRGMTMLK
jgi:hypothetical protein